MKTVDPATAQPGNPIRCAPASTAWPRATAGAAEAEVAATAAARTVLVAGASGLVGREILAAVSAADPDAAVHALVRRPLDIRLPGLSVHVVDFAALPPLPRTDDVFVALGTTIKVAGSQAAFRAVDLDAVVAVARAARSSGATRIGVVSALGADPASAVFYNRVKGEMERAVATLGFDTVVFARPSLLLGDRDRLDQPVRPSEKRSQTVMGWLRPLLPARWRAIAARDVAVSLVEALQTAGPGIHILPSEALQRD
jgi:uncharacterized protein YbjT (DUF2867 family)